MAMKPAATGTMAMKPVAAGIEPGCTENADVTLLTAAGNVTAPRDAANPYRFGEAIAPHVAARERVSG